MRATWLFLLLAGCGSVVDPGGSGDGGGSTGEVSSSSTTGPGGSNTSSSTTLPEPGSTSGSIDPVSTTTTTTDAPGDAEGGCAFLCPEDTEGGSGCSIWDQDCPPGETCTPLAEDGSWSTDGDRCVPLVPDPTPVGEPCVRPGPGDVDATTGTCSPLCTGTPNNPDCADPSYACSINGSGTFALCFPLCDPLDPDACLEGRGCYATFGFFTCLPDASDAGGGVFEPCGAKSQCDPGSSCAQASEVGQCDAETDACCTPFCDLDAPTCPGGTTCQPYHPFGADPGFEHVGTCLGET